MTFSGPYEGIQRPYGRILAGNEKKSEHWLPTGVIGKAYRPGKAAGIVSIALTNWF